MFFILKNKLLKNGEAPVVLRVTINGQRDEIRIQRSISVELWDNVKMRSKGRGRSSAELNMYIETLRDRIYVIHRNSVYDGERLTPKKILDILYAREGRHQVSEGHEGMHRRMGGFLPGICILPPWHVTTGVTDWWRQSYGMFTIRRTSHSPNWTGSSSRHLKDI